MAIGMRGECSMTDPNLPERSVVIGVDEGRPNGDQSAAVVVERYRDDPVAYVREVLHFEPHLCQSDLFQRLFAAYRPDAILVHPKTWHRLGGPVRHLLRGKRPMLQRRRLRQWYAARRARG